MFVYLKLKIFNSTYETGFLLSSLISGVMLYEFMYYIPNTNFDYFLFIAIPSALISYHIFRKIILKKKDF